ncbi:MAG: DUF3842 family protein [Clostridiaceae bacterium]|jgi:hypothetical protein|nr:DUF3842 family protein [Eubacteriales bacterium]NLV48831.1 DUF3842 family protein [Clostridiaceae bacterium]
MTGKHAKIVVIDGQGGGIGRTIIEQIRLTSIPNIQLIAVGTNALATANMLKAGADAGATGESAVLFNCRDADVILGVIGVIAAGSMYGELNAAMAAAVSMSPAAKILIPVNKCGLILIGFEDQPLPVRIQQAVEKLKQALSDTLSDDGYR